MGRASRGTIVRDNLVGNAVKFTDAGEICLCVICEHDGDPMVLRIEVCDTGAGIPWDRQAMLFQPLFQADSSSSRKFGGTGLGLSIVSRVAGLMGCETGFESEPGLECSGEDVSRGRIEEANSGRGWRAC